MQWWSALTHAHTDHQCLHFQLCTYHLSGNSNSRIVGSVGRDRSDETCILSDWINSHQAWSTCSFAWLAFIQHWPLGQCLGSGTSLSSHAHCSLISKSQNLLLQASEERVYLQMSHELRASSVHTAYLTVTGFCSENLQTRGGLHPNPHNKPPLKMQWAAKKGLLSIHFSDF
jgi:hypothetical protein